LFNLTRTKQVLLLAIGCLAMGALLVLTLTNGSFLVLEKPAIEQFPPTERLSDRYIESFDPIPDLPAATGYLARFMLNSPEDLEKALLRAEELYSSGQVKDIDSPLAFVLHGPEVQVFLKNNYQQYKSIVDLAARLSAFDVVDMKVCQTRLGQLDETEESLPPFIETVPFGPAEVQRLLADEQYVYF